MGTWNFNLLLLHALLFVGSSISMQPNTDEFYVYDFLQKTGGDVSSSSSSSSSICPWKGVVCEQTDGEHIRSLSASGLGLRGPIPENTIGKLGKLEHLDLGGNGITGFSSDFWGLGGSIRTFNLSLNRINGSLPHNIGNFGRLEILDLSHNRFSGEIPPDIGSLSSLRVVNLSSNMFSGGIPDRVFDGCKLLASMDLSSNNLTGSLPTGFGEAFRNLSCLNLAENRLTGNLPDFSVAENLAYIDLSGNLLRGPLAAVLLPATLQVLDMSNNQLEFSNSQNLSAVVAKLQSLEYLNLSGTHLSGGIPVELSRSTRLKTLDLSRNSLIGSIEDFAPESLQVLDLSYNSLTGKIPPSLWIKLSRMSRFNFSYNNLTICFSEYSRETTRSAFIGSKTECPIAVDPNPIPAGRSNQRRLKLALAISFSTFCLMVGLICLACRRGSRKWMLKQISHGEDRNLSGPFSFSSDSRTWIADIKSAASVPVAIFEKPLVNFTFVDLLSATSHFDRGALLADGRFGPVYRGLLPGGIQAAVRILVDESTAADDEAIRELESLGRVRHPNLVSLTGYCIAGDCKIAIYEYMENGNLRSLLHDEDSSGGRLGDADLGQSPSSPELNSWRFRHRIVLGTARALAFLHHGCSPRIIHGDVKASSVFLDSAFEPRLSDFGLAKREMFQGSPGYSAPEFLEPGPSPPNAKTDVYAFGVVLFEVVTGRKPVGEEDDSLVDWVRGLVRGSVISKAIDPRIRTTGREEEMEEALRIGYLCTADEPSKRPSMQQIVGLLKDIQPGDDVP